MISEGCRYFQPAPSRLATVLNDFPVRLRARPQAAQIPDRALDARSVLVNVPSFSRLGRGRQDHIGETAGLAEKNSCTTKKSSSLKRPANIVGFESDNAHLFPVSTWTSACPHGWRRIISWLSSPVVGRAKGAPQQLRTCARTSAIAYLLVTGYEVRHGAVVAGSLHVVVSAQRIGPCAGPHVIAGDQQQIRNRRGGVGTHASAGLRPSPRERTRLSASTIMCATCSAFPPGGRTSLRQIPA